MVELIAQSFANGITIGALYGLAAIGLSLTFGVMRILNIAHGEFLMLGGYVAFWMFTLNNIDPFLGLPLVAIGLFLLGAGVYKVVFSGVARLQGELRLNSSLLVAFGLFLIFPQIATMLWTGDERAITPVYSGTAFEVLGIRFGYVPLAGLVVAVVVTFGLQLFLNKTYFGKSVRGTAENWKAARLMGINVDRTYLLTFALGAALAGVAGILVGLTQWIAPFVGMHWTLKVLIVIVLAGMGSIGGTLVAGMIIGVAEAVSHIFIGPYAIVVGLVIFLLIMMFRPQGLFGKA